MSKVETYVSFMEKIAADPSHGYDQATRNGGVDYDCSSLVGTALSKAGYKVNPASTTRNLRQQLIACGFTQVAISAARQRGDIFLKEGHHVVACTDANNIVHASVNEKGTATGGKPGDQTGKEICTRSFYNYTGGWDFHFRAPSEGTSSTTSTSSSTSKYSTVLKGYSGSSVVDAFKSKGLDSSFANRAKYAAAVGISNYKGTAEQNTQLIKALGGTVK